MPTPLTISEVESNDTFATAQSLDPYFDLAFDAEIQNSTAKSHASVNGTGDGSWDLYSFTLNSASSVLLDIDHGWIGWDVDGNLDSWLEVFDAGGTLMGANDDKGYNFGGGPGDTSVDPGSLSAGTMTYDSWLDLALGAGQYFVRVGRMSNGAYESAPLLAGQTYTLHVSKNPTALTEQGPVPAPVPVPAAAPLMLSGLGIMGAFMRRRKAKAQLSA